MWRLTSTPRAKYRCNQCGSVFPYSPENLPPRATSDRRAPTRECTIPTALLTHLPPKLSWKKAPRPTTTKPEVSYEISAPKRADGVGTLNGLSSQSTFRFHLSFVTIVRVAEVLYFPSMLPRDTIGQGFNSSLSLFVACSSWKMKCFHFFRVTN